MYQIKPDMLADWEQFNRTEGMEAYKKAGYVFRAFWQTATFGPGFRFARILPLDKFAAFDHPSPLVTALGQEEADRMGAKARRMFDSVETVALQLRDDLSFPKELTEQHRKIAVVTHIKVMPGKAADFERIVKTDVVPAMRKADVNGFQVYETLMGRDPNEWHAVTYFNNYADFDREPPLLRGLGQEGLRKLEAKSIGIISSIERETIRYREDMSYVPARTTAAANRP